MQKEFNELRIWTLSIVVAQLTKMEPTTYYISLTEKHPLATSEIVLLKKIKSKSKKFVGDTKDRGTC